MKLPRAANLRLCLLLALLLPWQAFAALTNCSSGAGSEHRGSHHSQQSLLAADGHCDHDRPSSLHHGCGSCCSVAAAGNPLQDWHAPRSCAPVLALARIRPPPSVTLDRLDRPPRIRFT